MAFQAEKAQAVPEKATDTTHLRQMEVSSGSRLLFIDNLRILLICLVVVQHLSVTYGATGFWYYRDPAADPFTRTFLTIYDGIPQASGMGIFFLIAGYFTPGSFDRKGMARFLRDRLMRLGTPWLLYELLLDPLVVYLASGLHGSTGPFTAPIYYILARLPMGRSGS